MQLIEARKVVLRLPLRRVKVKPSEVALESSPWSVALGDRDFDLAMCEVSLAKYNIEQANACGDIGRAKEWSAKQYEILEKIENILQKHGLTVEDLLK